MASGCTSQSRLSYYKSVLGPEWNRLKAESKIIQSIESDYENQLRILFDNFIQRQLNRADLDLEPDWDAIDVEDLLIRHQLETMIVAYQLAESGRELKRRLGKGPGKPRLPKSLKDLMKLWNQVRKRPSLTTRARDLAKKVKKQYLKKIQSVWQKYGEAYRRGDATSKEEAVNAITRAGKTAHSRAKTIIETETTYYNNHARREFYDGVEGITHYLYLAVRDQATTKWCKTRHGVIFKKDTKLLEKNTPPTHWNCRSEIVPLSPSNPRHRRLIENKSNWAENKYLAPLPKGWNER